MKAVLCYHVKQVLKQNLIHPCSSLDQVPDCASLIYSIADHPMKRKSKKSMQEKYVNQCMTQENKSSTSKWECQANVYKEDDKNYHVNMRAVKSNILSVF